MNVTSTETAFDSTGFAWYDYLIFVAMLAVSTAIGIYFGFFGKKQNNKNEYLLAGKSMNTLPVAISLIASVISGIMLMSYPADVYKYGSNLIWLCLTLPVTSVVYSYVFLPVFFKLQVTSLYEYLHLRFDRKCRIFVSFIYTITLCIYNTVVIYVPSIALAQGTRFDIFYIALVLCGICIFYTTVGGLKAVIWTDAFQFLGMVLSTVGTVVVGIIIVGGFKSMWNTSLAGQRLEIFDFRFDLTLRDNFWVIIIGATIHINSFVIVNQGAFQKCLAVPTLANARCAVLIFSIGMALFIFVLVLTGNVLYANYSTCDPLSTNQVQRHDQLLPYFVIKASNSLPGLLGIFMAGIFSAALSSFSSVLNTMASTVYEDFLSPVLSSEVKKTREGAILKLIVVISGIISTALVLVVERAVEILPFIVALQGMIMGPMLGLFTLGVLFPMANSKGALIGGITGLLFLLWIGFGNLLHSFEGVSKDFLKPLSVEGCNFLVNNTITPEVTEVVFVLYRISFWYYVLIGAVITIAVGIVVSFFTKKESRPVDKKLVHSIVHRFC